jgi:hypothetical protein
MRKRISLVEENCVDAENGCVPKRVFDLKLICEHADANAEAVKISVRLLGRNPHWRDALELALSLHKIFIQKD